MRLMRHVSRLESTLRHGASRPLLPALAARCVRLRYSSTSAAYPERIAVLGGGVAGLSSAYFVSREFPKSKITVFEAGENAGGWMKSKKVAVPGGEVLFELGPRTLRNSTVTAHLVQELGLIDQVTYTNRDEPAAKNRYIYYPDRLNRLPAEKPSFSEFIKLWQSGIMAGAFGFVREFLVLERPELMTDETVGSFIERRMDKRLANNLISAVFHGIYAGDIWKLSAKTLLSTAWHLEDMYGTALSGYLKLQSEQDMPSQPMMIAHPYDIAAAKEMNAEFNIDEDFAKKLQSASTYTFKEGLQQLITTLQEVVEKTGNVDVKVNSPVQSTAPLEGGALGVQVSTGHNDNLTAENYDLVISTLRNDSLTPYVTVQTVNLYYSTPNLHPYQGFGYLIPQSVPFEQNPERALGVIFDSYTAKGQDTVHGTKLTIMLGGHWWDSWTSYPTPEEGLEMAKSVVERHLGITEEPAAHFVNLSKDCIPQYTVGYEDRLKDFKDEISQEFKGRLRVVGNQFNGVGVNDVVTGAWNVARGLRGTGWQGRSVGLDKVGDGSVWKRVPVAEMAYITKEKKEKSA